MMIGTAAHKSGQAAAIWRWVHQGARIYLIRSEWRPKHFLLLGMVAVSLFAPGFLPQDGWLIWVAFIPFLMLSDRLKNLPIHFGRRPPNPLGSPGS
jgi:hypothetical protein